MTGSYRHNHALPVTALSDCQVTLGHDSRRAMLCNDRAVFLPDSKQLVIADVHLGKATHFRQAGLAIPAGVMVRDLARLARLIQHYNAEQVIIAGDFFHDVYNHEVQQFIAWRDTLPTAVTFSLVPGNHDRLATAAYHAMDIAVCDGAMRLGGNLVIRHDPPAQPDSSFSLCGHIHPGVVIGRKRQAVKLACFVLDTQQLILPAFSLFTGLDTHYAKTDSQRLFALTTDAIVEYGGVG